MKKDELITVFKETLTERQKAKDHIKNIQTKSEQINNWYEGAQASIGNVSELETSLKTAKDAIIKIQKDVQQSQKDINEFYNELFEEYEEDSHKKNKKQRINDLEERLKSLVKEQSTYVASENQKNLKTIEVVLEKLESNKKAKFEQIEEDRKALFSKINSLLPTATSAGLAASYREAHDDIKSIPKLWCAFSIVILGLFGWYAYFFFVKENHSIGEILAHVLTGSPLIWLAWYLQKSISQQNQIRQEYNHKQRVMNMYEGFVKAIDKSGSKAQREELLSIMLKTVQSNPADILNGHDTFIDSIASKIPSLFKENSSEESKKDA